MGVETRLQARFERARELLRAQGLDAAIAASPANVFYFTDVWVEPHERLLALVIPKSGDPVLFAPQMHAADVANVGVDTVLWRDGDAVTSRLAALLPAQGAVAVDDDWPSRHLVPLLEERPGLRWRSGGAIFGRLRRIKDADEIERLREAGRRTDQVLMRLRALLRPGLTEREVVDDLAALWRAEGVTQQSFPAIVAAGPNGARPHHVPDDAVISDNDLVVVDIGGVLRRYCSDVTRTFAVGAPVGKARDVYEVVREAQAAALRVVRPGVPLAEVDRAARSVIESAGYGAHFTHRTGHGVGIDIHEEPYVHGDNQELIEPGMVFSIEPGIYLEGQFGVRIEDVVVVTEDGCEPLTKAPKAWTGA
jgi:Xaa-Pro dipeptidase